MQKIKWRTRKDLTLRALEEHFVSFDFKKQKAVLNAEYLNKNIMLILDNDRACYDAMVNQRRKPTAVVWQAFTKMADDYIREKTPEYMNPGIIYYASSSHLKEFLNLYGNGYETLKESIEYVEQERKRIREEETNA